MVRAVLAFPEIGALAGRTQSGSPGRRGRSGGLPKRNGSDAQSLRIEKQFASSRNCRMALIKYCVGWRGGPQSLLFRRCLFMGRKSVRRRPSRKRRVGPGRRPLRRGRGEAASKPAGSRRGGAISSLPPPLPRRALMAGRLGARGRRPLSIRAPGLRLTRLNCCDLSKSFREGARRIPRAIGPGPAKQGPAFVGWGPGGGAPRLKNAMRMIKLFAALDPGAICLRPGFAGGRFAARRVAFPKSGCGGVLKRAWLVSTPCLRARLRREFLFFLRLGLES